MKKAAVVSLLVAGVLASLLFVLGTVGNMRNEKIRQQPPLTAGELDALAKSIATAETANTDATAANGSAELSAVSAAAPPGRLNRMATDVQRREMFMGTPSTFKGHLIVIFGSSPFGAVADAAAVASGSPTGESWACAMCNLLRGDWKDAKGYLQEFLRTSTEADYRQLACGYLAWLEDDPEQAVRYMDVACSGSDWRATIMCVDLASASESTELFDYCMQQGRSLVPDFDTQFARHARFARVPQDALADNSKETR